MIWKT